MNQPQIARTRTMLVWMALALSSLQGLGVRQAEAAGGLKITPARTDVTIAVGEPAPAGSYQVKNTSARTLTVTATDNVSWLTLSPATFSLSPGATQVVSYTTTALSAGGPYAAQIYFTAKFSGAGSNAPVAKTLVRFIYRVVSKKADIAVTAMTVSPSTMPLACNKPFTVKATVKNLGAKPSGPFRIRWSQNNSIFYTGTHSSLNGGAVSKDNVAILNFKKGKPAGYYSYMFSTDINYKINEVSEINNDNVINIVVSCP